MASDYKIIPGKRFTEAMRNLDNPAREAAGKRMEKILVNPLQGKPLRGEAGWYSERFLCYRIIYKVEGDQLTFVKLGKRDDVYR
ncbi:MAG: type II toxin-antitoxin system RelE/ParE family toxin [Candidatus Micrarchaeia archaeon]